MLLIRTVKEYTDRSDHLKIGFSDRLLRTQNRRLWDQKRLAVTWLTEWLVAAQEYLWSKQSVVCYSTELIYIPSSYVLPQHVSDKLRTLWSTRTLFLILQSIFWSGITWLPYTITYLTYFCAMYKLYFTMIQFYTLTFVRYFTLY
jgi:hypothetical protein